MNDVEDAMKIYEHVLELDSGNKAALQQILTCKQKIKDIEEADKRRYRKLFAKIHKDNDDEVGM